MIRLLKWLLILASVPFEPSRAADSEPRLGLFEKPSPRQLLIPRGDETFDTYEALHGSFSSPAQCDEVPNGLWIEVDGKGDCIRYYTHGGLDQMNRALQVMVFFSGDAMLRTSKGVRFIGESYGARSPASIEADMAQWSVQAGVPAIFLARPGLNGSSGDHNMRRRVREIDLMDAALDRLKERHGISSFILVGQSGGGHLVASLLNRRSDISAAVISSGLLSVKRYMSYWARVENLPEWGPFSSKELYDPVEEVDRIAWEPTPRIFIISDPDDRLVPFFTQLHYVRRLRAAGFEPQHVYAHAADRKRHHLFEHGRRAAALLAQGKSDRAIRRELHEMDLEHLE